MFLSMEVVWMECLPIIVAKPQAQYWVSMVPASFEDVTAARLAPIPMKGLRGLRSWSVRPCCCCS